MAYIIQTTEEDQFQCLAIGTPICLDADPFINLFKKPNESVWQSTAGTGGVIPWRFSAFPLMQRLCKQWFNYGFILMVQIIMIADVPTHASSREMSRERSFGLKLHRRPINSRVWCFVPLLIQFRGALIDIIDSIIGSHRDFWIISPLCCVPGVAAMIPFLIAVVQLYIICSSMKQEHQSPWIHSWDDLSSWVDFSLGWFHSVSTFGRCNQ
jgi:hypothetical protein